MYEQIYIPTHVHREREVSFKKGKLFLSEKKKRKIKKGGGMVLAFIFKKSWQARGGRTIGGKDYSGRWIRPRERQIEICRNEEMGLLLNAVRCKSWGRRLSRSWKPEMQKTNTPFASISLFTSMYVYIGVYVCMFFFFLLCASSQQLNRRESNVCTSVKRAEWFRIRPATEFDN